LSPLFPYSRQQTLPDRMGDSPSSPSPFAVRENMPGDWYFPPSTLYGLQSPFKSRSPIPFFPPLSIEELGRLSYAFPPLSFPLSSRFFRMPSFSSMRIWAGAPFPHKALAWRQEVAALLTPLFQDLKTGLRFVAFHVGQVCTRMDFFGRYGVPSLFGRKSEGRTR